ncbi:MAG: hypothetical protein J2P13_03890 [Acidobacteria bacterium]|nr:hypothetical protein [Acidobacteriota bacterium]
MAGKEMTGTERIRLGGDEARGAVLMTVGKLLLWTDLIFLSFVYSGFKGGSNLYGYWTGLQGAAGLALVIAGRIQRGPWAE